MSTTPPDYKTRATLGPKGLTILLEASNNAGDGPALMKPKTARQLAVQLLQLAEQVESFEADEAAYAPYEH